MNERPEARQNDHWMPVMEHLGELRKRIFYCLIVLFIGIVGGLFGAQALFDYLVAAAPTSNLDLNVFSPWDAIGLYVKFAFIISLIVAIPFTMYQLWAFVRPALGENEQRSALRYVPGALFMFLLGLAFAYFVVFPMAYLFTEKVTASMGLNETYGVSQYFTFLFNILVPISLLFELPVLILFLTRIGILNPFVLEKARKVAWFLMILIGVMITPPDVVSDLLVAIPLVILYEVSVLLSKIAYRKRLNMREQDAEAKDNESSSKPN